MASYSVEAKNEEEAKEKYLDYFNAVPPGEMDWSAVKSADYLRKIEKVPEGVENPIIVMPAPLIVQQW